MQDDSGFKHDKTHGLRFMKVEIRFVIEKDFLTYIKPKLILVSRSFLFNLSLSFSNLKSSNEEISEYR